MTDHDFLAAMKIVPFPADPLQEALRIDDLRSDYCEMLERRITEQQAEIDRLRHLLRGSQK